MPSSTMTLAPVTSLELARTRQELLEVKREAAAREAQLGELQAVFGRQATLMQHLHWAMVSLLGTFDVEEACSTVLQHAMAAVSRAEHGHLFLIDGGTGELQAIAACGYGTPQALRFVAPRDQGYWWPAARGTEALHVPDLAESPQLGFAGAPDELRRARAVIAMSLLQDGMPMGLLVVTSPMPHAFNEEDVAAVQGFAIPATLAVQQSRLYTEVRAQAHTDTLTGVLNRRGFFAIGAREVERARRFERGLVGMMVDIDHFKRVNDTHGHYVGDQVLARVAARCSAAMRGLDIIGRYGGEEFAGLMLEVDPERALLIAERIRHSLADNPIPTSVGCIDTTVSIGLAALDADTPDLEGLLDHADHALYAAKAAGRNRVAVWHVGMAPARIG